MRITRRKTLRKPLMRLAAALLVCAMAFSAWPQAALAEETEAAETFTEAETEVAETFAEAAETPAAETTDPVLPAETVDRPEDLAIPAELLDEAAEELEEAAPEEAPFLLRRLSVFLPEGALTDSFGAVSAVYYPADQEYILDYDSPEAAAEACELLSAVYGADRVLPDILITAQMEPYTETEALSNSWGTDRMQTDLARDLANADPSLEETVVVAVLDGGFYREHEMLAGRLTDFSANFIDDEELSDGSSHGTHVSGIVADGTPDRVLIMPVKILDSKGNGSFSNMIRGVQYSVDHGADVINMSFGVNLSAYSQATIDKYMTRADAALRDAAAAGCVCVCASGNEGGNTEELISYPAVSEYVFAVGSVTQDLERASTSNYGAAVDLAAPGAGIRSAGNTSPQSYVTKSGTSMATPHIAAACALIRLYNPDLPPAFVLGLLRQTCVDLGAEGRDSSFGWGMPVFQNGEVPIQPYVFTDVTDPGSFYYTYVYWAAGEGITTGWSEPGGTYTFRPFQGCNRAAVVTFLWRYAGCPEPSETAEAPFSDMPDDPDFCTAILWAVEQGITTGFDDGTFRPWNTCNRAAIVTFLWRFAGRPEASGEGIRFSDMPDNEDFCAAILWAAEQGITTGYDDGTFRPWTTCSRVAVVSFLGRYDEGLPEAEG